MAAFINKKLFILNLDEQEQKEKNRTRIERIELIKTDFLIHSNPFDQLNPRSIKSLF